MAYDVTVERPFLADVASYTFCGRNPTMLAIAKLADTMEPGSHSARSVLSIAHGTACANPTKFEYSFESVFQATLTWVLLIENEDNHRLSFPDIREFRNRLRVALNDMPCLK